MRRLLIKLVAIETALVGWLSYWIFLVYANNPSVSAGLGDQLTRFPQLAFTTVDIAVMVIIATFAITLAFKFHRGLRPGIRLERALQMLENLMKRNLVLEAQVAELRVDKVPSLRSTSTASISVPGLPAPSFAAAMTSPPGEPNPGSWEKAFRTPLEAGPPAPKLRGRSASETPFQGETGIPPPRIEARPPMPPPPSPPLVISEKSSMSSRDSGDRFSEKPMVVTSSSAWEDSPKYVGESTGVLTPAGSKKAARITPDQGLKQPYIPVPAPRMTPPSVIVGPMTQKPSPGRQAPRPIVRPTFPSKPLIKEQLSGVSEQKQVTAPIIIDKPETSTVDLKSSETTTPLVSPIEETKEKPGDKPADGYKKKSPREED
ncbi:MAG: hypothetical protein AUI50_07850 [Crenarchaeota archaeon 13_1_40CM_2_52_14]|nr:MAG: hypothetical protein AUI97_07895 [Crenarchaeota archaeon 13_1_40CM_3_52_17]OLD34143.1 MAG: hypothetical protein AUI50_07850 [Crenarchaeota archaeon 13_1_40CM_2_52_14]OLE91917.1 MAG: hypothetical protein AUF79_01630 [Crenarchaeota archaeon 13_1_20CM_2_51_8]